MPPKKKAAAPPAEKLPPKKAKAAPQHWLTVRNARHNNLRGLDVHFPLGRFVAVTGVSGSGKSSLVNEILRDTLARDLNGAETTPGACDGIDGAEHLDKVIDIDQTPIGRTPRSNPATYIKVFDQIRDLYTKLPESLARGYQAGRFSFNVPSGRCEGCEGNGSRKLAMEFLADVWVPCPLCQGRRFNRETLQVRYRDRNIHDVLEMDIGDAVVHFENLHKIHSMLKTLADVGLDYMKLGQPSPTLSGGEAQRIKLARELCKRSTGRTLYVLDEPTTGLHFADIRKLLAVLHGFVDAGNTVVVIEHNLDVVKTADWVIDIGPEGGRGGGRLVAEGTPEEIAACPQSHTGRELRPLLERKAIDLHAAAPPAPAVARMTHIEVVGARQHNLQDVSARLPLYEMSVFCGPSGSGKSSLAIDTLYAEGQRRYVESLSSYARQFLGQMQKPRVESVRGLAPAICIEQKTASKSPRSTVGTITEIYDYFRVLFARLGTPHCPACKIPIGTQTSEEIVDKLLLLPDGARVHLLAPIARAVNEDYDAIFADFKRKGFARVRVDGKTHELTDPPKLDRKRKHEIQVVVDRVAIHPNSRSRLADSVEAGLDLGQGVLIVAHQEEKGKERDETFSQHFACDRCGRSFEELSPNNFSFNAALGWCHVCEGLGVQEGAGAAGGFLNEHSPMFNAVAIWPWLQLSNPQDDFSRLIKAVCVHAKISEHTPFNRLKPEQRRAILYGTGDAWLPAEDERGRTFEFQYKGLYPALAEAGRVSPTLRQKMSEAVGQGICPTCQGSRLREDAAAVRFGGRTIGEWSALPLGEALSELSALKLPKDSKKIAEELLREIKTRLKFLVDVGLDYLTLARSAPGLSGGEAQRIRLASQLGSGLTGVLYLLDEPTIGLHPRDNHRLLHALKLLRDLGNTLVLVEHDREVIDAADHLVDFGPGAGRLGGRIVAAGTPKAVGQDQASLTGAYLSGRQAIPVPSNRRAGNGQFLRVVGATHHNLQRVDAAFPLGMLTCVTGVSGSGKSSLVNDVLWANAAKKLHRTVVTPGAAESIDGLTLIDKVIRVDQTPLGNTPASNPATYTGFFDLLRELYAALPESKLRGYTPGRFSFNRPGGRCEACEGVGQKKIEMHFLPDVWVPCGDCGGKRFVPETLSVQYQGVSIADALELSVDAALERFGGFAKLKRVLQTLADVGLGYMALGQAAPTLSGGEAQRVKLAAELARPNTGKTLYVLDEPTTGLHFDDIRKLLDVLHRLVDLGNTVVVIEHNLDVIKTADWLIDIGPEAGDRGGTVVFAGTPEGLVAAESNGRVGSAHHSDAPPKTRKKVGKAHPAGEAPTSILSHTAVALAPVLAAGPHAERKTFDPQAAAIVGVESFADVGKGAKMPWEVDGRKWHTESLIGRLGRPPQWEKAALGFVIDELEKLGALPAANWNDRYLVEIPAPKKSDGWFFHALTGEEWLLRLKFRCGKAPFKAELLDRKLGLKPLAQMPEIPRVGFEPRLTVRRSRDLQTDVEMTVFRKAELDTPAFREFVTQAAKAFVQAHGAEAAAAADEPWLTDGEAWHRGPGGFDGTPKWKPFLLDKAMKCLAAAAPDGKWDWNSQDSVKRRLPGIGQAWARVTTKKARALEINLVGPKGAFNMARLDAFGERHALRADHPSWDTIRFVFTSPDDFHAERWTDFLAEHAEAFRTRFDKRPGELFEE